ncbi:endonuclease YncB(thermonuclease family) [Bradyrhizobium elkanii]
MKTAVAALFLGFMMGPAFASEISGTPRIVDGDTIEIGTTKIRLEGIDAPESDQLCLDASGRKWACGISSRDALSKFAGNRPWTCRVSGSDRYGRSLATCFVDGQDIERWMVRSGWALAFERYSTAYATDEAAARSGRTGLWSGAFIAPWDWRSRNSKTEILGAASVPVNAQSILLGAASSEGAPDPACTIKAGESKGECIYHAAGDRWYAKLDMTKPGRRWFCTVEEAVAAGCRAPKRQ